MPELPEVETVRRILEHHILDASVSEVSGTSIAMRRPLDIPRLRNQLRNQRLTAFRRRGKYLLVDLSDDHHVLIHLGMSGRLMLQPAGSPILPHSHLILHLDQGLELRLVDPRRFGFAYWLAAGTEDDDPSLSRLGVDPLDPSFDDTFPDLVRGRRAPLKALLLDQRLVAGVGNIYANEALWRAGVSPRRSARRTSRTRLASLGKAVREVLLEAIAQGGTTIRDYATPEGAFGYFAVRLAVYGRAGRPCPRCSKPIRMAFLGGRSTTWCPQCQR